MRSKYDTDLEHCVTGMHPQKVDTNSILRGGARSISDAHCHLIVSAFKLEHCPVTMLHGAFTLR